MKRQFLPATTLALAIFCQGPVPVFAQEPAPPTPAPPVANLVPNLPGAPIPQPAPPPPVVPAHPAPTAAGPMPAGVLVWDSESKEYKAKVGEPVGLFTFNFTNASPEEVTINHVQPSCGCTTVQLPPMPWKITPGTDGQIPVKMTLTGVPGTFIKNVTVNTDKGWKMLMVKTTIETAPAGPMTDVDRERNQLMAKADRQSVFRGDCARCHVEPAVGKVGKDLYTAACGICHEAEHRASIVPDLHHLPHETNAEFWKTWISYGKDGTLMPAFAEAHGGPLTEMQIATLVDYLAKTIPSKSAAAKPDTDHAVK